MLLGNTVLDYLATLHIYNRTKTHLSLTKRSNLCDIQWRCCPPSEAITPASSSNKSRHAL